MSYVAGGRTVAPGRGWDWIKDGWILFKRNPVMWIAVVVIFAVLFIGMVMVPILGQLAAMVLGPVFTGGLMLGCRAQEEGGELQVGHLFAGFRERFAALATVGLLYVAASAVIAVVVGLATGAGLLGLFNESVDPLSPGAGMTVLLAFLVMLALMLPVFMAMWFASPLVVFHGLGAVDAMKNSFDACLRNLMPFLLYGAILLLMAILASIPFGLGWLLLGPVMACSLYAAYRDVFFEQSAPAPQPGQADQLRQP